MGEDAEAQIRDAIAEQAAEWCVRNQAAPLGDKERVQFVAWLRSSPLHVEEYLAVATILGDLPAAASRAGVARNAPSRLSHAMRPRVAWAAAAGLLVTVLAAGSLLWLGRAAPAITRDYQTAHGQQATWGLPDGSVIRLNTDTAIAVSFTATERVVQMTRGQAYFEVAHDKRRPFRVDVNGMHVVAVGTRFDVYQRNSGAVVTVADGRVAVFSSGDAPALATATATLPAGQLLGAGQRLVLIPGAMSKPESVDLAQAEAWLHRQVIFRGRPLGEVVDEFNRYTDMQLELTDERARRLEVSGVFDAYDTESFLAFVATIDGVVVTDVAPGKKRIGRAH